MKKNSRNQRLDALRVILATQRLDSQDDILAQLESKGIHTSQSTLSRDLKKVKAQLKKNADGIYYSIPESEKYVRVVNGKALGPYSAQLQDIANRLSSISQLMHELSVEFQELASYISRT